MKYSFRLYFTGPKTKINANWGLPLNLQVCPKCNALNHKLATQCTRCSQPLSEPRISAGDPAAIMASAVAPVPVAGREDIGQNKPAAMPAQISDAPPPSPATGATATTSQNVPAAADPTPDPLLAHRQIVASNEQKWLRLTWGVVLALVLLTAAGLLIFSSLQSPFASFDAAENTSKKGSANSVPMPAPAKAANAVNAKQSPQIIAPDDGLAGSVIAPEPAQHSADARKSTDASVIENRITESAAPANTRCSEAARALALCDVNAN